MLQSARACVLSNAGLQPVSQIPDMGGYSRLQEPYTQRHAESVVMGHLTSGVVTQSSRPVMQPIVGLPPMAAPHALVLLGGFSL